MEHYKYSKCAYWACLLDCLRVNGFLTVKYRTIDSCHKVIDNIVPGTRFIHTFTTLAQLRIFLDCTSILQIFSVKRNKIQINPKQND